MFLDFCIIELKKQKKNYIFGGTEEFLSPPKHLYNNCSKYIIDFSVDSISYVLYEFIYPHESFSSKYIIELSNELKDVLYSAIKYPPIIAISKEIFSNVKKNKKISSVKDFEYIYTKILSNLLIKETYNHFFLAKALVSTAYHLKKQYYWILAYIPNENIVFYSSSHDFFIYDDPLEEFEILDKTKLYEISYTSKKDFFSSLINIKIE